MFPRRTRRRRFASLLALVAGATLLPAPAGDAATTGLTLDCSAENGVRTAGGRHSAGCIAYDATGSEVPQIPVDVEASGANDVDGGYSPETPDFTCVSPSFDPWCTWTHGPPGIGTTNDLGTTVYRAWIDADGSNASVEADASEARDEAAGAGAQPEPDATDVIAVEWEPPFPELLDCDDSTGPATDDETNPHLGGASADETYTCTLTNAAGTAPWRATRVYAEVWGGRGNDPDDPDATSFGSRDYGCTIDGGASCRITVTQADDEVGASSVCFYVEVSTSADSACGANADTTAGDGSDVADGPSDWVGISWEATGPVADRIEAEPESSSTPVGGSHTITTRVHDQLGSFLAAHTEVKLEFFSGSPSDPPGDGSSPGSPDATCNTSGASECSFTYSQSTSTGTDRICVWTGPAPVMSGTNANGTCEGEGPTGAGWDYDVDYPGYETPPPNDDVDVVLKTWEPTPPPAATVDCDDWESPSTDDEVNPATGGTGQGYRCELRDANGALVKGDTQVRAEVVDAVNDPDSPDGASFGSADYSCSTGTSGACNVTVTQADGEAGTTHVCFYAGSAAAGATACATEPFDEGLTGGADSGNDLADTVRLTWEPRVASYVTVHPESSTGLLGSQHVFSARVWDQFGGAFSGNTQVKFERFAGSPSDFDGNTPGTPDRTCTTADFHQCSWGYTQANHPGTDNFCAWIGAAPEMSAVNGYPRCDGEYLDSDTSAVDVVARTWRRPVTYLDCDDSHEPSSDDETNVRGNAELYTCTLTDSAGQPVVDERVGGIVTGPGDPWWSLSCRTGLDGKCSIQSGGSYTAATYEICFYYDGSTVDPQTFCGDEPYDEGLTGGADAANDLSDRVRLSFADRTGVLFVDAEPETSTGAVGTDHKVTGAVYDEFGDPWVVWDGFAQMRFELFAGSPGDTDGNTPETPDRTCFAAWQQSHCSFTYTQSSAGIDVFCAWSGTAPAMSGTGPTATCNGEGTADPDDDAGAIDQPYDAVDVFTRTWEPPQPAASYVDCDDAGGSATEDEVNPFGNGVAGKETYTCKVVGVTGSAAAGAVVRAEVTGDVNDPDAPDASSFGSPDYTCTTGSAGTCTVTVTEADEEVGTTTVCFTVEEGAAAASACSSEPWWEQMAPDGSDIARDSADAARLTWQYRVVAGLDVEPEASTGSLGAQHVITMVVYDQFGERFKSWHTIYLERFSGSPSDYDGNTPGTPDRVCSTNDNAQCSFGYTQGTYTGTDVFCAWTGVMANPVMSGTATGTPVCGGEGLGDADDEPGALDAPEPSTDAIDLVTRTWQTAVPPAALDCDDTGGPQTETETTPSASGAASVEGYSCRLTDANGSSFLPDSVIRAEVVETVNDPDSPDGASFESVDYFCNTGNDGTCDVNVAQSDAETGATTVCFYSGTAAEGAALCAGEPFDEAASADGSDAGNDLADAVRVEWQPRVATGLDVEPEASSTALGTNHVVTAVVYDQFGDRFAGSTPVKLEWFTGSPSDWNGNSPASPDRSCTTQNASQCSFGYTQANHAGTDVFCAWIGSDPAMTGTSSAPSCNGEGLVDGDDDAGTADAPAPASDGVDLISKTWLAQ